MLASALLMFVIWLDETLTLLTGIKVACPGNSVSKNVPIEPIEESRRRRLLVESTFESLHGTHSIELEVSSTRKVLTLQQQFSVK
ncbi:unnamed protein product [Protopolystoma xenopodis]|uniref:Secreted protein n=1 Tax=Protopolystoma xenopodis TaxID=117903 RepID=A0A3S4ZNB2_9PLAT|nr:unnamed protein product [Protopolystoma xenopodis]